MKISELGEFGLIERIRKTASRNAKRAPIGIGDDAAALLVSPSSLLLATTDMLIEGIHFDLATTDLASLGWKSAAVNLSDIAAMGGTPRFCLTALGIPPSVTVEQIGGFYRGINACLKKFGTALAGGDTCKSNKGLIIAVTVLGEAGAGQAVTRSGAEAGDRIFVTGSLGDSAAGLELLKAGVKGQGTRGRDDRPAIGNSKSAMQALIQRHLRPVPRVEAGRKLAAAGVASAMIDVSDGLSSDLGHICNESGVGAEVFAGRVPVSKQLQRSGFLKRPPLEYALSGGEDYELLFTVPEKKAARFRALGVKAVEIGRVIAKKGMFLVDQEGGRKALQPTGYDHFRRGEERRFRAV